MIKAIQSDGGSEEAIDNVLSILNKFEDDKIIIYTNSDLNKNLLLINQKCIKVLETTSKFLNIQIPVEAEDLKKKTPSGDLSDLVKRGNFYLSIFFKMVKDATGVDNDEENLDAAMSSLLKKQAVSMLPFDPVQLLNQLKAHKANDLQRLKFLSGFIRNEKETRIIDEIEEKAAAVLQEHIPANNQETMENINFYLHHYPAVEKEINDEIDRLLQIIIEKLTNSEPSDTEVNQFIESSEKLDLAVKKLNDNQNSLLNLKLLQSRKNELPTKPKELIPYFASLIKDYSDTNLELVSKLTSFITPKEDSELKAVINKKINAAPVLIIKDIQHLFFGVDTNDLISIIVKLHQIAEQLLCISPAKDTKLHLDCIKRFQNLDKLTDVEIKKLGLDYVDLVFRLVDFSQNSEEIYEETEVTTRTLINKRGTSTILSTITWDSIFKSKGLDIDGVLLCESMGQEQLFAKPYLEAFSSIIGNNDQKNSIKSLLVKSEEIFKTDEETRKIENYAQLRLEESKTMNSLSQKLLNVNEKLIQLDNERASLLKTGISELSLLIENNNPAFKDQLSIIIEKEDENLAQKSENLSEIVLRLSRRLGLEKEIQRIKEDAKPRNNSEGEIIKNLSEIEEKLYSAIRTEYSLLINFSDQLYPNDFSSLKYLTESSVGSTVAGLYASLKTGIETFSSLFSAIEKTLSETPIREILNNISKTISTEAALDDFDTEVVFSSLLRFCGTSEDKSQAKKLRESRIFSAEDKQSLISIIEQISVQVQKLLKTRSRQSGLQAKLLKKTAGMTDSLNEITEITENILNKVLRETTTSILFDDTRSKSILDLIRKNLEEVNETPSTNIQESIDKLESRLKN